MFNNSPVIERHTKHHTWVAAGVALVSIGVGVWQGEKNRSAAKKAQKNQNKSIEAASIAQTKQTKIKQLRAENAQLGQALLNADGAARRGLEGGSGDNTILYIGLGIGAVVLLTRK